MEKVFIITDEKSRWDSFYPIFIGCSFITLCSLVKIPFYPVPFTLQTFAIFILALTQSPIQAFSSAALYLGCASLGLPVLCGKAKALWLFGKCGGYLLAFPFSAYLTAKIAQKHPFLLAVCAGQCFIYLLGFAHLSFFVDAKTAFIHGIFIFLGSDLLKNLIAIQIITNRRKQ